MLSQDYYLYFIESDDNILMAFDREHSNQILCVCLPKSVPRKVTSERLPLRLSKEEFSYFLVKSIIPGT